MEMATLCDLASALLQIVVVMFWISIAGATLEHRRTKQR
jgi:hypothetical protein